MDIKQLYREDTGEDVYSEEIITGTGTFSDEYVKWLEDKVRHGNKVIGIYDQKLYDVGFHYSDMSISDFMDDKYKIKPISIYYSNFQAAYFIQVPPDIEEHKDYKIFDTPASCFIWNQ